MECYQPIVVVFLLEMVRSYKKKTDRGKYGMEKLTLAMEKVRNGELSKRKAESLYGIPRKTLTRHLCKLVASRPKANN